MMYIHTYASFSRRPGVIEFSMYHCEGLVHYSKSGIAGCLIARDGCLLACPFFVF